MDFLPFCFSVLGGLFAADRAGWLHASGASFFDRISPQISPEPIPINSQAITTSSIALVVFAICVLAPMLVCWRYICKRILLRSLANACLGRNAPAKRREKFLEQAWLAVHFTMMTATELYVLQSKPWWPPLIAKWEMVATLEQRHLDQEDLGLRAIYAVQLGFYVVELITLLCTPKQRRRSDAAMYFFHHIYTILLLAGSWLLLCHRFGSLILILHDVGDVFLPIGKCFSYAETHVKQTCSHRTFRLVQAMGTAVFLVFVLMFIIPRILIYGGIVYTTGFELGWTVCCGALNRETLACSALCPSLPLLKLLMMFLLLLWPMQLFWTLLIFKMAIKIARGVYQDVRSDNEEAKSGSDKEH